MREMGLRARAGQARAKWSRLRQYPILTARILTYRWLLSTNREVFRTAHVVTPVLAIGTGTISAAGAQLGYFPSPYAYDGCIHLETRGRGRIEIGPGSMVNNGCVFIAAGAQIRLGRDVLLGPRVTIVDSDFHRLEPSERRGGYPRMPQRRDPRQRVHWDGNDDSQGRHDWCQQRDWGQFGGQPRSATQCHRGRKPLPSHSSIRLRVRRWKQHDR